MDKRKYIEFILGIFIPFIAYSNPWIPDKGSTKIIFDFENHILDKAVKNDLAKYHKIAEQISRTENHISRLNILIYQAKSQRQIDENIRRLELYKQHKIEAINSYIKQLKKLQGYLYYNAKSYFYGSEIEYGLRKNISIGMGGNFSRLKFSSDTRFSPFFKYRIYQKKGRILTFRNYFEFSNDLDIVGIDILFGKSKFLKQNKKKAKNKLVKEIFNYSSLGIIKNLKSNFTPSNRIGYRLENTSGVRLKKDILLIFQKINHIDPNAENLYSNIIKTQYKISKEYKQTNSKITLSLGYFTDYSVTIKKLLSSGYNIGLWIEL